jgi:hypothetical protein
VLSPPTATQAASSALGVTTNAVEKRVRSAARAAGKEAEAVFRRKAIYEELHPETKHGGDRKSDQVANLATCSDRFTIETAAATGKAERTIQRAANRGKALGKDLSDITGTSLDKGSELDALAKMAPEERAPIIERAKAGEQVSARTVVVENGDAKSHTTKIDPDVRKRCDMANAARAVECMPHAVQEAFITDLFAAGHKSLAIEIKNLVGECVFDKAG